jgi:uncharacterized phiE125 gp8 family phage protein
MRKLITGPTTEPVSSTEAKLYLKVDHTDDDDLITILIQAAREVAEKYTGRSFIDTVWECYFDDFPETDDDYLPLYPAPVNTLTSVTYYNSSGVLTTMSSTTEYLTDMVNEPARVFLRDGQSWPETDDRLGGVIVKYTSGYGSTSASVPDAIRTAVLLIIGHLYENRQDVAKGDYREMPMGSRYLLDKYRVY